MKIRGHQTVSVVYQTFILNPDGSQYSTRRPKKNLILDQGLNNVASNPWLQCFMYAAIGTGTNPTQRDSGTTTASQAANTVTASAGFFSASDVGRLIKFDTGEEVYISGYTSPTQVTVSGPAQTIAAVQFTVWYVNDLGLQTESKRTNNVSTGGGENGTTYLNGTLTNKRTFLFPAETGAVTYNEIGWSASATAGANLNGRDVISGGDSLVAGQQYKVQLTVIITVSPVVATARANNSVGFDSSGSFAIETVSIASGYGPLQYWNSGGLLLGASYMEPSAIPGITLTSTAFTLTPSSTTFLTGAALANVAMVASAYVTGSFTRTATATFSVNQGNTTNLLGLWVYSSDPTWRGFTLKFTTPQTKDNSHTLKITYTITWGRVLVN